MDIQRLKDIVGQDLQALKRQNIDPNAWSMDEVMEGVKEVGKLIVPNFTIDKNNRFVYENLIYWLFADERMRCYDLEGKLIKGDPRKGIYLAGTTGTGKTIATEVMVKMAYALGIKIKVGDNTPALLKWKNIRADEVVNYYVHNGECEDIKKETVICFQDLGTEALEALYMGNRVNVMRRILEYRGDRRDKMTLITSNISPGDRELHERYGDRVVSRLSAMCNILAMVGPDRRL